MQCDEFKELCRKAWSEKFNNLCIDKTKNKVNIVFSMKTKTHILNAFLKLFCFLNAVPNQKQTRTRKIRRRSFLKKSNRRNSTTRQVR